MVGVSEMHTQPPCEDAPRPGDSLTPSTLVSENFLLTPDLAGVAPQGGSSVSPASPTEEPPTFPLPCSGAPPPDLPWEREEGLAEKWDAVAPQLAEVVVSGGDVEKRGEELGLTQEEVGRVVGDPGFQAEVVKVLPHDETIRDRFMELAAPSVTVLQDLLKNSQNEEMKFKVAKDLLDRAGFTAARKVMVISHKLSKEDTEWMKGVAGE